MNGKFFKSPLFVVLFTAFLLRIIYFLIVAGINPDGFLTYDSHIFMRLAENMISHNSFSVSRESPLFPEIFRLPGYPFFLSIIQICKASAAIVIILQTLMSTATCLMTYRIAMTAGFSEKQSLISAFIISVDITSIVYNCLVMSETLFTLLFVTSAYFFMKYLISGNIRNIIACALFTVLSLYVRAVAFFIPLIFCLFILCKKSENISGRLRHSAIFLSLVIILLFPWYARNYLHFGIIGFSTSGTLNLYNHHAVNIYSQKYNLNFDQAQIKLNREMIKKFKVKWPDESVNYARLIGAEALKIIFENPFLFMKQQIRGMAEILIKPSRGAVDVQLGLSSGFNPLTGYKNNDEGLLQRFFTETSAVAVVVSIIEMIYLCTLYAGLIFGIVIMYKQKNYTALFFLCVMVIYFATITAPPATYARFRVPAMPFIAILSAAGWGVVSTLRKN